MTPALKAKLDELEALAKKATGGGKQSGYWFVVDLPWLPRGCETYIIDHSPDPHAGKMVCDFQDAAIAGVEDEWTDDEWSSRNWANAEYIQGVCPAAILALIADIRAALQEAS